MSGSIRNAAVLGAASSVVALAWLVLGAVGSAACSNDGPKDAGDAAVGDVTDALIDVVCVYNLPDGVVVHCRYGAGRTCPSADCNLCQCNYTGTYACSTLACP